MLRKSFAYLRVVNNLLQHNSIWVKDQAIYCSCDTDF